MKAVCNKCNREFELTQGMLCEKYIGAMITESYYLCPKCNCKHFICIQSSKTRKIKFELDKTRTIISSKRSKNIDTEADILKANGLVKDLIKQELELMEKEMVRFKALGRERDWQRQYVKWQYLKPLVDSLEVQINDKEA